MNQDLGVTFTPRDFVSVGDIQMKDVKIVGTRAYVALRSAGVAIYDVTDAANINSFGSLAVPNFFDDAEALWVNGNTVFVLTTTEGPSHLLMFDATLPNAAVLLGDLQFN